MSAAGGYAKGVSSWKRTLGILRRMAGYVERGHSVAQAANLTFKGGLGTSMEANRKMWHRHKEILAQYVLPYPD